MANPIVGYVDCPHCGELATVHREARGMRAMYYRCYDRDGLSMRCGTVQIRGPAGQIWITENMRSEAAQAGKAAAPLTAAANDPEWGGGKADLPAEIIRRAVSEVKPKRRRGLWDLVAEGDDDD